MKIVIVEDEKKMAAVLKKGLEADNHRVILAYDGRSEHVKTSKSIGSPAVG